LIYIILIIFIICISLWIYNSKKSTVIISKDVSQEISFSVDQHTNWIKQVRSLSNLDISNVKDFALKIEDCFTSMPFGYTSGIDEDAHRDVFLLIEVNKVLSNAPEENKKEILDLLPIKIRNSLYPFSLKKDMDLGNGKDTLRKKEINNIKKEEKERPLTEAEKQLIVWLETGEVNIGDNN